MRNSISSFGYGIARPETLEDFKICLGNYLGLPDDLLSHDHVLKDVKALQGLYTEFLIVGEDFASFVTAKEKEEEEPWAAKRYKIKPPGAEIPKKVTELEEEIGKQLETIAKLYESYEDVEAKISAMKREMNKAVKEKLEPHAEERRKLEEGIQDITQKLGDALHKEGLEEEIAKYKDMLVRILHKKEDITTTPDVYEQLEFVIGALQKTHPRIYKEITYQLDLFKKHVTKEGETLLKQIQYIIPKQKSKVYVSLSIAEIMGKIKDIFNQAIDSIKGIGAKMKDINEELRTSLLEKTRITPKSKKTAHQMKCPECGGRNLTSEFNPKGYGKEKLWICNECGFRGVPQAFHVPSPHKKEESIKTAQKIGDEVEITELVQYYDEDGNPKKLPVGSKGKISAMLPTSFKVKFENGEEVEFSGEDWGDGVVREARVYKKIKADTDFTLTDEFQSWVDSNTQYNSGDWDTFGDDVKEMLISQYRDYQLKQESVVKKADAFKEAITELIEEVKEKLRKGISWEKINTDELPYDLCNYVDDRPEKSPIEAIDAWLTSAYTYKGGEEFELDCGLAITTDQLSHRAAHSKTVDDFVSNIRESLICYNEKLSESDESKLKDFYKRFQDMSKEGKKVGGSMEKEAQIQDIPFEDFWAIGATTGKKTELFESFVNNLKETAPYLSTRNVLVLDVQGLKNVGIYDVVEKEYDKWKQGLSGYKSPEEMPEEFVGVLPTSEADISDVSASKKTAIVKQKKNENTGKTEWCLVSKSDPSKVLKWFGVKEPSDEAVAKEEKRVQFFKHKGAKVLNDFIDKKIEEDISLEKIAGTVAIAFDYDVDEAIKIVTDHMDKYLGGF